MRISGVTYVPRKSRKAGKIFWAVIALFAAVILAISFISAYLGWNLVHPENKELKPFTSNIVPEYKDISFYSMDKDITLSGWLFNSKNSDKTMILAHSYGQNRLQFGEKTIDIIKTLIKNGYNVFTFDFRNSGKSDGKKSSLGYYEKEDLLGAVNYVKSQGSSTIALMGFSTGASTCLLAAADSDDVDAVVADSAFSDLQKHIDYRLSQSPYLPSFIFNKTMKISLDLIAGIDTDEVSPVQALEKMNGTPIFFIHASEDSIIPVDNSREMYETYSKTNFSNAEYWELNGLNHLESFEKNPDKYMKKVLAFLEKHIK